MSCCLLQNQLPWQFFEYRMILFLAVLEGDEAYSISLIDGLTNSGFLLIQIRSPVTSRL
jgi:hypothetical protein